MPPTWCSGICRNAMNEICIEACAVKRDCSAFEEKPNLKLVDMPRFPKTEGMTREEKFTSVTIYLSKVVDHLQGIEDEPHHFTFPRALSAMSIDKMKAIAEVAVSLKNLQNDTAGVDANEAGKETE